MSEKTSRIILIIEAVLALPISGLAVFASGLFTVEMFSHFRFHRIALGILALISLSAVMSGWRLFIAFLRGGASKLQKQHFGWWLVLLAGVLVLVGSLISVILPPSPEYSAMWTFRFDFDLFISASPLLIPLTHLALEKFLRKPVGEAASSEPQEFFT